SIGWRRSRCSRSCDAPSRVDRAIRFDCCHRAGIRRGIHQVRHPTMGTVDAGAGNSGGPRRDHDSRCRASEPRDRRAQVSVRSRDTDPGDWFRRGARIALDRRAAEQAVAGSACSRGDRDLWCRAVADSDPTGRLRDDVRGDDALGRGSRARACDRSRGQMIHPGGTSLLVQVAMPTAAQPVVIAVGLLYFAVIIGISVWAARRTRTANDFFVAGKGIGLVALTVASVSVSVSGFAFIGGPGFIYAVGLGAMFIVLPAAVTNVMGAWVLAKRMRLLAE